MDAGTGFTGQVYELSHLFFHKVFVPLILVYMWHLSVVQKRRDHIEVSISISLEIKKKKKTWYQW